MKRIKTIRGAHKAVLTRTIGQVMDLLKEEELDIAKLNHKGVLTKRGDTLKTLDYEILIHTVDDAQVKEIKRRQMQ